MGAFWNDKDFSGAARLSRRCRAEIPPATYALEVFTNTAMRSMAILIWSRPVAKLQRTCPSPLGPKAVPGTTATLCSCRSRIENSLLVSPVEEILGNT